MEAVGVVKSEVGGVWGRMGGAGVVGGAWMGLRVGQGYGGWVGFWGGAVGGATGWAIGRGWGYGLELWAGGGATGGATRRGRGYEEGAGLRGGGRGYEEGARPGTCWRSRSLSICRRSASLKVSCRRWLLCRSSRT